MGIALGCIRLTYDDFCRLDYTEFAAIYQAYAEQRETDFRSDWQRMRLLATITVQPHLAKGKRITPEKLIPFPWDKQKRRTEQSERRLTGEQQRQRMRDIAQRLGDKI